MRTFSSLLVVTFIGVRMAWWIGYRTASVPLCIGCMSLCHWEGRLFIYLLSESNDPKLLDEPLKGFIVNPACSPWKLFGSYKPGHMGIMAHSESVQPLQSVKLVYQPYSWSRAALEYLWNSWSLRITGLCYSLFMFTMIMCLLWNWNNLLLLLCQNCDN